MVKPRKLFKPLVPGRQRKSKPMKNKIRKNITSNSPQVTKFKFQDIPYYGTDDTKDMLDIYASDDPYLPDIPDKIIEKKQKYNKYFEGPIMHETEGRKVKTRAPLNSFGEGPRKLKTLAKPCKSRKPNEFYNYLERMGEDPDEIIELTKNRPGYVDLESLDPQFSADVDNALNEMERTNSRVSPKYSAFSTKDDTNSPLDPNFTYAYSKDAFSMMRKKPQLGQKNNEVSFNKYSFSSNYNDPSWDDGTANTRAFLEMNDGYSKDTTKPGNPLSNKYLSSLMNKIPKFVNPLANGSYSPYDPDFSDSENNDLNSYSGISERSKSHNNKTIKNANLYHSKTLKKGKKKKIKNDNELTDITDIISDISDVDDESKKYPTSKKKNKLRISSKTSKWDMSSDVSETDDRFRELSIAGKKYNTSTNAPQYRINDEVMSYDSEMDDSSSTEPSSTELRSLKNPKKYIKDTTDDEKFSYFSDYSESIDSPKSMKKVSFTQSSTELNLTNKLSTYDSEPNHYTERSITLKKKKKLQHSPKAFDCDVNNELVIESKETTPSSTKKNKFAFSWNTASDESHRNPEFDEYIATSSSSENESSKTPSSKTSKWYLSNELKENESSKTPSSKSSKWYLSDELTNFGLDYQDIDVKAKQVPKLHDKSDKSSKKKSNRNKYENLKNNKYDAFSKIPAFAEYENSYDRNYDKDRPQYDSDFSKQIETELLTKMKESESKKSKSKKNEMENKNNFEEELEITPKKKIKKPPRPLPPLEIIERHEWFTGIPLSIKPLQTPVPNIVEDYNTDVDRCFSLKECKYRLQEIQKRASEEGKPDLPYSFLIGDDGRVYEGRGWDSMVTDDFNWKGIIIGYIGRFSRKHPPGLLMDQTCTRLIQLGQDEKNIRFKYNHSFINRDGTRAMELEL